MAAIDFYQEESEDTQEEENFGLGLDDGEYGEQYNPDEGLTPIQKLEKYMECDNFYNRQMVARSLLEVMRMVADTDEDPNVVLKSMVKLSEDPEPGVRTELMEQIPHIAMYCQEYHEQFDSRPISTYILPIIVKYLLDSNNQVRKTSQAAMVVLLDQGLISKEDVEEHICPVVMQLSNPDSLDDFRTEAVALMSKMAGSVGKDITERIFLPRFAAMCTDSLFHVRKVCATNFGEMCSVVGQENTEQHLLNKFFFLCEDGVWGVRKACAECFMQVSCSTSQQIRQTQLAQLFINLICDQSRWVRMAAFQALGGFISTFADPNVTGLFFNEEGVLMVGTPEEPKKPLPGSTDELPQLSHRPQENSVNVTPDPKVVLRQEVDMEIDVDNLVDPAQGIPTASSPNQPTTDCDTNVASKAETSTCDSIGDTNQSSSPSCEDSSVISSSDGEPTQFNEFLYWRPPLPEIDVVLDDKTDEASTTVSQPATEVASASEKSEEKPAEETSESVEDVTKTELYKQLESDLEQTVTQLEKCLNINSASEDMNNSSSTGEEKAEDEEGTSVDPEPESKEEIKLHSAEVVTAEEVAPQEEVANIGSMHVLGQQVHQKTMAIVDGVVQDLGESYSESSPLNSLNASADDSYLDDPLLQQDVIPQTLLEHYLSMIEPSRAQTVDSEIAKHCAYSLPAVAYTLGRRYWPCLNKLYETLAADMQWKVRRTLAFSIHELAVIVGTEIACRDLVPIFNGFLKDLDEVRIGVLRHLADFLRLLTPEVRHSYLDKIPEFLNTDNTRNWRFREELAAQLLQVLELFSAEDVNRYLVPVAMDLAEDRVSQVRQSAFHVLSCMLKHLNQSPDEKLPFAFVNDLLERFAQSNQAAKRQMFSHTCHYILLERAMTEERFARDLLPSLLGLASDPVANVRISVSKVLASHILTSEYFTSANNPHHEDLLKTVQQLQTDKDRDVRYFVSMPPQTDLMAGDKREEAPTIPV